MTAVVFDFGYTLVNEDRVWGAIAAQYGWPASILFATLGAVIERRGCHRDVFELLGAAEPYEPVPFEPRDFYEDALPSRIDNDIVPAARAGMLAVHIRRGPWAAVQQSWPEARAAAVTISDLNSIPA